MPTQGKLVLLCAALVACSGGGAAPEPAEAKATVAPQKPAVVFVTPSGEVTLNVEVADDPAERSRGLMHRKSLGKDDGMVFVFPSEGDHPFWMKNTYISLDMMWVSGDRKVVGIKADTEPLSTTSQNPNALAKYVVEANAGYAAAHGIAVGTEVRFVSVPLVADK